MDHNDSGRIMEHFREIEETAEEVLSDKQEIVDLDRKRCQNREAIRALSHIGCLIKDGTYLVLSFILLFSLRTYLVKICVKIQEHEKPFLKVHTYLYIYATNYIL